MAEHVTEKENRSQILPPRPQLDKRQLLNNLYKSSPNSVVFTVLCGFNVTRSPNCTNESNDDVCLPKPLYELYHPSNCDLSPSELSSLSLTVFEDLNITESQSEFLEKSTRNQASCSLWFKYRQGLITASTFHSVLRYSGKTYPTSIVKKIMQYYNVDPSIPSLKWGRTHENVAIRDYTEYMKHHDDFKVNTCGLFINPSYPYLGTSPDGIVTCSCCGKGLMEINCTYKYKDLSPSSDIALADKNFFLEKKSNGNICLRRSHSYYDQVQGQLAICDLSYCDFVCWTKQGIFVERIIKDTTYLDGALPCLKQFFHKYLLPEVMTHQLLLVTSHNSSLSSPNATVSSTDAHT